MNRPAPAHGSKSRTTQTHHPTDQDPACPQAFTRPPDAFRGARPSYMLHRRNCCDDATDLESASPRTPGVASSIMRVEILRRSDGPGLRPEAARNPFHTAGYAAYRQQQGELPCLLSVPSAGETTVLVSFLRQGVFGRRLEIPSLPELPHDAAWWRSLLRALRRAGITYFQAQTFGSPEGAGPLPARGLPVAERTEFVLDLRSDLTSTMSSGHRRNVRRGQRAGLHVRSEGDPADHGRLTQESLRRRRERREDAGSGISADDARAVIASGAGRLYQAMAESKVVSSMLVLRAPEAAYYHSAGTSADGMVIGASHWLLHAVAQQLRDEGVREFNLGGVPAHDAGLARFKRSFGARSVATHALSSSLAPRLLRPILALLRRLG